MENISILIADDHQLFREGLKLILSNIPYIAVVQEVSNGKECVGFFEMGGVADLVFMDIEMPVMNGLEAATKVLSLRPEQKIVALSMYSDENYYTNMIDAGVKGFILKNSGISELEDAIELVISGNYYFSPGILSGFVNQFNKKRGESKGDQLSEREAEVLHLICQGHSNQKIADMLNISKRTVDKHRENLLSKTGTNNTAGLVVWAIKNGVILL